MIFREANKTMPSDQYLERLTKYKNGTAEEKLASQISMTG
jgi:hypothetical protein